MIGIGTGRFGNKRTSGDKYDYRIIRISQNTEKSPGDLRGFAVIQTSVKNHQLTLVRKTMKGVNHYNKLLVCSVTYTSTSVTPVIYKKDFKRKLDIRGKDLNSRNFGEKILNI